MGKKPNLPTLPLVAVVWDDAHASSGDFIDASTLDANHCAREVITLGWVLRDDEVGMSVGTEFADGLGYRGYTFIPRSLVQTVITIKKSKSSKPSPLPPDLLPSSTPPGI